MNEGGKRDLLGDKKGDGLEWVIVGEAVRRSLAYFEGKAKRTY